MKVKPWGRTAAPLSQKRDEFHQRRRTFSEVGQAQLLRVQLLHRNVKMPILHQSCCLANERNCSKHLIHEKKTRFLLNVKQRKSKLFHE